jgi:hypothetical protein
MTATNNPNRYINENSDSWKDIECYPYSNQEVFVIFSDSPEVIEFYSFRQIVYICVNYRLTAITSLTEDFITGQNGFFKGHCQYKYAGG